MMESTNERWGRFRFQVVGLLLAAPQTERGDLKLELDKLADRTWSHPITGATVQFARSTIERWYYRAVNAGTDTAAALARRKRCDAVGARLDLNLIEALDEQYRLHNSWSAQLHWDNLQAFARKEGLSEQFSYQTLRRYLRKKGMIRQRRKRGFLRKGEEAAIFMREQRETRSYEATHVGSLWHLDLHHAKRPILTQSGEWAMPILFAVIDDHSRLICHAQWYFTETTRDLVHGFSQALMRRGLPRLLMSDNGSAMTSAEFTQGLSRLGINHATTMAYSPNQNGKIESWWGQVESTLMAMLERKKDITLNELNRITHAWIEMDYHHQIHSTTKQTPIDRFMKTPSVMRSAPTGQEIRMAFRQDEGRKQRRSDGTVSIEGVRYEVPNRFRHMHKIKVRYARWDLSEVSLVSEDTGQIICALYPVDKAKNANAQRRKIDQEESLEAKHNSDDLPAYLAELIKKFDTTGLAAPFICQPEG
jgi:putative transposase